MNPQYWQALGGIIVACGALYGVVTVPILRLIKAESELAAERLKLLKTGMKTEMTAMETRLNERIADKLNEHGERIRNLEERRFR